MYQRHLGLDRLSVMQYGTAASTGKVVCKKWNMATAATR